MTLNLKNALLAGTALVAVGFSAQAQAAVVAQTLTGSVEWATDGNQNQSPADGTGAAAGDTVNLDTFTLTVTDDASNTDGTASANFVLGAVTGTTGDLLITDAAAGDGTLLVTVASFATTSTGDFTVTALDAEDGDITVTVTNALTTGGALVVTNTEATDVNDVLALNIGGALTVAGTTTLSGAADPASTTAITVTGNSAFTGAVTVTGGAGAGSTATLTLNGATNAFTGGLTLTDGAAGDTAVLALSGSTAQTVSGAIAGDGDINVANASGVTFSGAITGTNEITVSKTGANSAATFQAAVAATSITLGDGAGTGTNTVTFDGTTAAFTVAGTVNGTANDTDNVVISGGRTITQSGIWGGVSGLDNLTITGSGTILDSNAAITTLATTGVTTIGSGATLDVGAGLLTSPSVVNSGTLLLSGTGGVTGAITGTGTLDVNENATVTGGITQGAVTVATTKTLTLSGANNLTAPVTLEGATATLALSAHAHTVTGNITTSGATGTGAVTVADTTATTAFVGDLGTSALKLSALTLAGGSNNLVTTTGNLYVNTITLDDSDVLQFLGTGAKTVSGVILGVGANDGVVTVGNSTTATPTVTFAGLLGGGGNDPGALTVNTGATAIFAAAGTHEIDGAITNTGTIQINAGDILSTAGSITDASVGTWNIGVDNTAGVQTNGKVVETGNTDISNDTIHFVVDSSQPLTVGTLDAVFNDDTTDAVITGATVTDNSYIYGFTLVNDTANDEIDATVAIEHSMTSLAATTANANVGNALLTNLAASTNAQINLIQGNLVAASTQAAVNEVLEATLPSVDAGAVNAAFDASVQSLDVTATRLASLREGMGETGMVAGEMSNGLTAWIQAFGKTGTQDTRDNVNGYDADTYGLAVGVDTANAVNDATVGVALSYASTSVDSENANTTETDVDSYQISVYGDYDITPQTYVTGTLAYAMNSNDQVRHNVGGVSGLTASADYDSNQYIAYAEVGHDVEVAANTTLTPSVLAHYQHIAIDDYTETGAGGANLHVENDSLDVLEFGVGAELAWDLDADNGAKVRPALNVGYRYDVIGDNVESTSNFTGGGASFQTQGVDPAQGTFNVGASVGFAMDNNWELTADYDYQVKEDYDAHSGYIRAGYKF